MENLNISEVLFYAPKGLMLYSPIFGEVEFIEIDGDNCIVVRDKHDNLRWFYKYGTYFPSDESNYAEGECLLFPSIDNRCWDNWQNILFPKSIDFVCVDTITGNKFILDHNGTFFSDGTGSLFLTLIGNSGNYLLNSVYASPSQTKEFFEELEKSDYEWVSDTVVRKKQNKPKFKVGDWLQYRNAKPFLVKEITRQGYVNGDDCLPFSWENEIHLWTIADAKDGDVLAAQECYVIFKEIDGLNIKCHCTYHYMGFNPSFHINTLQNKTAFHPATKEQRDLLFQKMKEEGYEWNAEKKELKKIDTLQPKFKVGDWVVNNNSGDVFQVTEIKDDEYCLWPLYGEICGYLRIIDVDTDYHLWTIQDAKDGDVLIDKSHVGECVFIFKEARPSDIKTDVNNPLAIIGYCGINHIGFTSQLSGLGFGDTVNCTYYPATKEQRDLLFQKMKEEGYQWDDDKKELKKIVAPQPKFKVGDWIVNNEDGSIGQITDIIYDELGYGYNHTNGWLHFVFENNYHLWTIRDAKDGDVLVTPPIKGSENNVQIFIFKGINNRDYVDNCIEYYCRVCNGVFYENKTGFMGTTSSTFYPATKGQRDFLFQKMKEEGYKWDVDAKKLIKTTTPIPKFKFGDIIKHKDTGVINSIKYVCSDYYVLDNNQALFFESQDMWELAASKANLSLEDKVSMLTDEILELKERVKELGIQEIKQCSDKNRLDSLESKMIILDSHNINERLDALESKVNALGLQAIRTTPLLTSASDGMAEDNVTLEDENEIIRKIKEIKTQ